MSSTYTITEAQAALLELARFRTGDAISITRRNKPVAALVRWERLQAMLETIEVLGNPEAMRQLRKVKAGQGRYHPLSALDDES
jgi:PHD/YefM family antitoxin component YafN of YafNO toxin-antitoxin module